MIELQARAILYCGDCQAIMTLMVSERYTYDNGNPRPYYRCSRFPHCRGTHSAHPDGSPMGTPADEVTKRLRHRAHVAMGKLQKERRWNTNGMYMWLGKKMGLTKEACHVGLFDAEQCNLVMQFVHRALRRK